MSAQLKTVISEADFNGLVTIESLTKELSYLRDRMKYYKENVSLSQIEGLLQTVESLEDNFLSDDAIAEMKDDHEKIGAAHGREEIAKQVAPVLTICETLINQLLEERKPLGAFCFPEALSKLQDEINDLL